MTQKIQLSESEIKKIKHELAKRLNRQINH